MFTFHTKYLTLTLLLLLIEISIALFIQDSFIRPYVGDLLVVILIYCFLKSFLYIPVIPTAIGVLLFACLVEFLQYLEIAQQLGLSKYVLVKIIIGTSFAWEDIFAYTLGTGIILFFELRRKPRNRAGKHSAP